MPVLLKAIPRPLRRAIQYLMVKTLPVVLYEKIIFFLHSRYWPDFREPSAFCELVAGYKLRCGERCDPLLALTADKLAVKDFVREHGGEKYVLPVLHRCGDGASFPFADIPRPYIIKPNNSCGQMIIIRTEDDYRDRDALVARMNGWAGSTYGWWSHESFYRDIPFSILAERLLETDGQVAPDYKFHTFGGRVGLISVDGGRFNHLIRGVYTPAWEYVDVMWGGVEKSRFPKPANLDEMLELAERLGAFFPQVRVDLYLHQGSIYFGELTHFQGGGNCPLEDRRADLIIGHLLRYGKLPSDYPR